MSVKPQPVAGTYNIVSIFAILIMIQVWSMHQDSISVQILDYSKDAFTFEFSIKNISAVTRGQNFISPEYTVNKLSWKISVKRNSNDKLSIFLYSRPVSFISSVQPHILPLVILLKLIPVSVPSKFSFMELLCLCPSNACLV